MLFFLIDRTVAKVLRNFTGSPVERDIKKIYILAVWDVDYAGAVFPFKMFSFSYSLTLSVTLVFYESFPEYHCQGTFPKFVDIFTVL